MYFPGHFAAPFVVSYYLKKDYKIAMVAGIFPDVIDKIGYYTLRVTPDPHVPTHTFLGLLITVFILWFIGKSSGKMWLFAQSWTIGYGLHIILDLLNGKVFFWWPFISYRLRPPHTIFENWAYSNKVTIIVTVIIEMIVTLWAFVIWYKKIHQNRECGV